MIRAMLDTNILISALITKKHSSVLQLYEAFKGQKFLLITSPCGDRDLLDLKEYAGIKILSASDFLEILD